MRNTHTGEEKVVAQGFTGGPGGIGPNKETNAYYILGREDSSYILGRNYY